MADSEEPIYSTMFSSLKHPVRRKILRVLAEKPVSFSQMLGELGVSSSHLTYHLESLGELVSKTDAGDYKLSTFGEAAVNTMRIVEDAPAVQSTHRWSMSVRWKSILGVLVIGIVLLAGFSVLQFNALNQLSDEHNQLESRYAQLLSFSASTDKAISFLRDVVQLELSKYDATVLSNTVGNPSELGGGVVEQILRYSLVSSESKLEVVFRYRNNMLSNYQMFLLDGSPIYSGPQPFFVVDSAKWLLHKLASYEDAPYLDDMNNMLFQFGDANSIEMTEGNMKFNLSISGSNAEIGWFYTENGVDFIQKGLKLLFENQALKELDDGYFLFNIGSAKVNIDSGEAIQIARNAVKDFKWSANGQLVSGYTVLQDPVSAVFHPIPREDPLALVPCWYVTLYLDNVYPNNVNRLAVNIWADTGIVYQIKPLSG
jgi:DNA-binding transcriptional ArsR family regulator